MATTLPRGRGIECVYVIPGCRSGVYDNAPGDSDVRIIRNFRLLPPQRRAQLRTLKNVNE